MVIEPAQILDDVMRVKEAMDAGKPLPFRMLCVTGRQARVLLGMPGRLVNKARMAPQSWRGIYVKVEGL